GSFHPRRWPPPPPVLDGQPAARGFAWPVACAFGVCCAPVVHPPLVERVGCAVTCVVEPVVDDRSSPVVLDEVTSGARAGAAMCDARQPSKANDTPIVTMIEAISATVPTSTLAAVRRAATAESSTRSARSE